MYQGIVHKGQDPDIVPGAILHVHDPFFVSPVQVQDCGIDLRGAILIHTYGFHEEERGETAGVEQLRTYSENDFRSGKDCSGAEGIRTDPSRRVPIIVER